MHRVNGVVPHYHTECEREGGDLDDWDAHTLRAVVCFCPLLRERDSANT